MTRQCELTRKNKILNERRHDYSNKAPESKKKTQTHCSWISKAERIQMVGNVYLKHFFGSSKIL